ncbi:uncharacterized protein LAESUDRAFT_813407 [Laetiporus sulphureus 93-53]|uniref:Hyaluronan/mRNA-binding protein domain-containing protein n=1 Tax=Laetiporus sulphureus 93-53 TaxID=1314785 RepID=A0A165DTE4_9APHY|nr:uncharacterized protein LAESUDRAFT_813407 [Laetiporus sulphureus 93-53]KZT05594.1 hypothetical protein LAESUDRAFT_813407 [Laetiporus sulphureus 93-53]
MTRTERASYPRAIIKDRSEAKNAMDKHIPKGGAGAHNWGDVQHEHEYEEEGSLDEDAEREESGARPPAEQRPTPERRTSSLTEEELQKAREFRKKALKSEGVDLAAIARTSAAVSLSPPNREAPITSDANTSAVSTA